MPEHEVIVRKYVGVNNRQQEFEQHGFYGYAVGFEGLIDFIMNNTFWVGVYPGMTDEMIDYMAKTIIEAVNL